MQLCERTGAGTPTSMMRDASPVWNGRGQDRQGMSPMSKHASAWRQPGLDSGRDGPDTLCPRRASRTSHDPRFKTPPLSISLPPQAPHPTLTRGSRIVSRLEFPNASLVFVEERRSLLFWVRQGTIKSKYSFQALSRLKAVRHDFD
ncbi:hypothetical protein PGT21_017853 [Puccinia graminis f. sp. tritici]|uniref:Uncharacterized protein n=1 Tax=Puccinia graminis f. sp. tritici TaxID=56615 RepID=A0A5B0QAJ8_PUCGR|nr:hypothetical protein PGT21_017853 [Puccinia graminis f. sp. tritici]KAA1128605.1 hypothetical protein PGTUg99_011830 [Puccinia graminis f. sp. tritici]